jgi:hypothetical protein
LAPQGYELAACFPERNTQLAKSLWLRDPAWLKHQAKAKADQALSEQSKVQEAHAKGMAQERQALQTANQEAKQAITQLQVKLAVEAQAKQDLQAQNSQALAQAAGLTKANEQSQTQLKAAQIELLQTKAQSDQQAQLITETQAEIDHFKLAKAKLEDKNKELSCLLEDATKLAQQRLGQLNELKLQLQNQQAGEAALATRHQLMQEEMFRAEAQLDLIKDFLLRESGL